MRCYSLPLPCSTLGHWAAPKTITRPLFMRPSNAKFSVGSWDGPALNNLGRMVASTSSPSLRQPGLILNRLRGARYGAGLATARNYFARYFIRISRTLPMSPAMAAGVTGRLWSVENLVALWEAYEQWRAERAAQNGSDTRKANGARSVLPLQGRHELPGGQASITHQVRAVCIDERGGGEARGRGIRWTSRIRVSQAHRCGTDNHSKVAR
jgi:hypothetical protein